MIRMATIVLCTALLPAQAQNIYTWNGATPFADWSNDTLWLGPAGFPDGNNDWAVIADTFIGPSMDVSAEIGQLTLEPDAFLSTTTNGYLYVSSGSSTNGLTLLQSGSLLRIQAFGGKSREFDTDDLLINGGEFRMEDSIVHIDDELTLTNLSGSLISGNGTILLTAQINSQNNLSNDGIIRASGGTLLIEDEDDAITYDVDLDGATGNGRLEAIEDSTLYIDCDVQSQFGGEMHIGKNATIRFVDSFEILDSAVPALRTEPMGGTSTLRNTDPVFLTGEAHLGEGFTTFLTDLTLGSDAVLNFDSGASVTFQGTTMIPNPGSISPQNVNGRLRTILTTTIGNGSGILDWDGLGSFNTSIWQSGRLEIRVSSIDLINDEMDAMIDLDGELLVQTFAGFWEMHGVLSANGPDPKNPFGTPPSIDGSRFILTGGGEIVLEFIDTVLEILCPATLKGHIDFGLGSTLTLMGGTQPDPNIIGPGFSATNPTAGRIRNEGVTKIEDNADLDRVRIDNVGLLYTATNSAGTGASIFNEGTLIIGDPIAPDSVEFTELLQLSLEPSSILVLEIQGTGLTRGVDYDSIRTSDDIFPTSDPIVLDGTLSLFLRGVGPIDGQEYLIIERASGEPISGTFDNEFLPEGFSIIYDGNEVRARYDAPCPADLNNDGELDFLDISEFLSAYSSSNPLADLNNDGQYDFLDISEFLTAYTNGCP